MWNPVAIISVACAAITLIALWCSWQTIFDLWLQAFMSDAPVSLHELLGLTLRKVDAALVVKCRIQLAQAGINISVCELESAYLQGADVKRVTAAAIVAKSRNANLSFKELVAADVEGQLLQALDGTSGGE